MGLEINSLLRAYGLNGIERQNKATSVSFRQNTNTSEDRFESNQPERFANEAVITKLVNSNSKIQSILKEVGVEAILNFQDLKPLLNNHCTDVRNISSGIVQNLPFSLRNFVDEKALLDASYLHDIGKVLIPSEILNKQGKLNETETKIMHKHSELSYEILKNTPSFKSLAPSDAQKMLADYERKYRQVKNEAGEILNRAEREIALLKKDKLAKLEADMNNREREAKARIAATEDEAIREISEKTAAYTIKAVKEVLAQRMTPAEQDRLIERSISLLAKMK